MMTKTLFTIALLIFVGAAILTVAIRPSNDPTGSAPMDSAVEDGQNANALVVYYFHGQTRCPTCRKIEQYAHEAIEDGFRSRLASGEVVWRTANYESPQDAKITEDYDVYTSSVVLVRNERGKAADWRNLERVWELVDDEKDFKDYVRQQTEELLANASASTESEG